MIHLLTRLSSLNAFFFNRKDTRNATAGINIEIIPAVPPIMEIECADPMLCLVGEGGKLFINPSSRQLPQAAPIEPFLDFSSSG